ncbi:MAG: hypothetical protein BWY49_00079 [Candidatus Omnitrophica bacterium ADurb.Bin314]|nr:MAG: hypothetical protein BWY49_00079 [Candidatus Omnitrophica bacterium ADurb.Bin314]
MRKKSVMSIPKKLRKKTISIDGSRSVTSLTQRAINANATALRLMERMPDE